MRRITKSMVVTVLENQCEALTEPEQKLWLAVIKKAIQDLGNVTHGQSAARFIASVDFEIACDFIGLGAESAREAIARIDEEVTV